MIVIKPSKNADKMGIPVFINNVSDIEFFLKVCKGTKFAVTLQTETRKMRRNIFYILFFCLLSASCSSPQFDAKRINRTLHKQEVKAMELTMQLSEKLQGESFDSIWNLTQNSSDNCLFYIFNRRTMVYWSDNWLAGDEVVLRNYDKWFYQRFTNAHCVCRWTRAGEYNILTIIPIRYAYPFENRQLKNGYVKPFRADKKTDISPIKSIENPAIYASDGTFLFTMTKDTTSHNVQREQTGLAESFSYRALLSSDNNDSKQSKPVSKVRAYYIVEILIYAIIILIGIVGLIRAGGFKNMKIRTKVYYIINALVLFASVYVFTISTIHMRERYKTQQRDLLGKKTGYIQKALQEPYFWTINLSEKNELGMNIDLRDLSFVYETDILVYDLQGNLVGSSTPALFNKGIVSRHIAPEPFFSRKSTMTQDEQIGDMHYLSAYTEFFNGNYVQIGYIAVPMFIYEEEVNEEVDRFLAKLLPANLIVLLLSIIISFFIVRTMTQPLSELSEKMKNLRIGEPDSRVEYTNNDEVGQLVKRYNEMVEQLELSTEKLAQSEREGAWRIMARQIAHEINNPLTPMKLSIQQLQRRKKMGDEHFDEYFDSSTAGLIEKIDELSRIAQSFSQFAKISKECEELDIAARVYSVISLFRNNSRNIPIRYIGVEKGVRVIASQNISQVFNNLIKNSLQATENRVDGDIIVILQEKGKEVEISVSDNGCGIPAEIQDKIFLPNFTTKSTGAGLGLAVTKEIVESSGGSISFVSSPSGTTFYVHLKKQGV